MRCATSQHSSTGTCIDGFLLKLNHDSNERIPNCQHMAPLFVQYVNTRSPFTASCRMDFATAIILHQLCLGRGAVVDGNSTSLASV